MKLREDFITQDIDDTQFLVPVGAEAFNVIARGNKTAAFIVDCLKGRTDLNKIVDSMIDAYEVDRDTAQKDAEAVIEKLRSIGAIEE